MANVLYAQSGGVTAVINASALGVIETVQAYPQKFGTMYAAINGISGLLREELVDIATEDADEIKKLRYTPGGAFGSCRYKLKPEDQQAFHRVLDVFKAHDIRYFFYNGGGDSQDTTYKIAQFCQQHDYPMHCIGIPKTIDNDLPITDNSPGFASVAKYVAVSTLEASLDVASMCDSSTKVFIMEVMGRHTGWIAAASGVIKQHPQDPPHIILLPERPLIKDQFLNKVRQTVAQCGFCVIVVSEGVRDQDGQHLYTTKRKDDFGHAQLGGVAMTIADLIAQQLGLKYHWAVLDYLQRSARHLASQVDVDQAYAVGKAAVTFAIQGEHAVLPVIVRTSHQPYTWKIEKASLAAVANQEKFLPEHFISEDGFGITQQARDYFLPLIQGEAYPPYAGGIPLVARLKKIRVMKKCPEGYPA